MTDDDKTNAELRQIRDEIEGASAEKRERLFKAYVETAYNGMQATEDDMPVLIIEYLRQSVDRYPSLMDVCDGVIERAAGKVMGLMLAHLHDGLEITIGEACDGCEEVAAMYISDLHKHKPSGGFRL